MGWRAACMSRRVIRTAVILAVAIGIMAALTPEQPAQGHITLAKAYQPAGLRLDPTITVGNLLTIIAMVLGGFAAWASLIREMTTIKTRVDVLWLAWTEGLKRGEGS